MLAGSERVRTKRWTYHLVFCIWMLTASLILVGSLMPISDIPSVSSLVTDKVQHAAGYFLLGAFALFSAFTLPFKIALFFVSFLIGVLIEFIQPLTGRFFELNDIVANSAGLSLALLLFWFARSRQNAK